MAKGKGDGLDYVHNYDVVVKWLAEAFEGRTLEAVGVDTGRIVDVFGFEPVDISVRTGRVDVMLRDDRRKLYHLEEQRDLRKRDMYRFAAHHFAGAGKWGDRVTDIIVASGDVYSGEKRIVTDSGTYTPIVVDLSERDGFERLAEIRAAVEKGSFENWLELVFLPLYGKETGRARAELAERVILFQTELFHAEKISSRLLAATLIMANKMIDKDRLKEIWEEIKMLDILEIAREEGIEEGKALGIEEGKSLGVEEGKALGIEEGKSLGIEEGKSLGIEEGKALGIEEGKSLGVEEGEALGIAKATREMLRDLLIEKYDAVPKRVFEKVEKIDDVVILKALFRKALKCDAVEKFESILDVY